jgi:hypothetical protein
VIVMPNANNRFTCDTCKRPAKYIQADPKTGIWRSVCAWHDPDKTGNSYWIAADRIQTNQEINDWTNHLTQKRWFDAWSWQTMIKNCARP